MIFQIKAKFYQFSMKTFKYSTSHLRTRPQEKFLIIRDCNYNKPTRYKYSAEKRFTSDQSKKFREKKKADLEKAYRSHSQKQNKFRTHTQSRTSHFHVSPQTQYDSKIFVPLRKDGIGEKKLHLKTESKSKHNMNEISVCLEIFVEKLKENLKAKGEKKFSDEYKATLSWLRSMNQSKDYSHSLLKEVVGCIIKCEEKKNQSKINIFYDSLNKLEKQKASKILENKKLNVKIQTLDNQISKLIATNQQNLKQMQKLKNKPIGRNCQVQTVQINDECNPHEGFKNPEQGQTILKLIKQIRQYKERQTQISILFSQLKNDGIDLGQTFSRGVKNMEKKKAAQQNSQSSIEESINNFIIDQQFCDELRYRHEQQRKKKNQPKVSHKIVKKQNEFQNCDADNSIIESMDALSFNYQDKELSLDAFTPRRIYQCKKPLQQKIKKKLQLNFDVLYEEISQASRSEGFPTI